MLSDEESAELAELRRRAWGAHPDLLDDGPALARLQELEEKARPPLPDRSDEEAPRAGWPEQASVAEEPALTDAEREAPDEPDTSDIPAAGAAGTAPPTGAAAAGGARRGVLLVVGAVLIVFALAAGVRSILNPASAPAASPTPTFAFATPRTLPGLQCGDGWGLSGTLSTPEGKPVWSRQFDFPISETWVMPARGARMVGVWVNLDVNPGTISDIEVVSPTTARLFYTAVKTWTAPPTPDEIIANSRPSLVLPVCDHPDSYPGFILARAPACVTLEFTVAGTTHYTVRMPVGLDEGARCPAQ